MTRKEQEKPTTKKRVKSRIPVFKTIEEEAEFWDTHNLTEFEDELEEVPELFFVRGGPTKTLKVRLDEESYAFLKQYAAEKGVRPSALARLWLFQRLWEVELKRRSAPSQSLQ